MKNISIFSASALAMALLFSSCKKEDDPSPSSSSPTSADYAYFDSNDRIQLTSPLTGNSTFTISANFKSEATDNEYRRIIGWASFSFEIADYGGTLYVYDGSWRATTATSIRDGNWHNVVAVNDGSNEIVYLDGIEVYKSASSVTFNFTNTMNVGNKNTGSNEGWLGCIDDVAVWNTSKTPYQIWRLMAEKADTSDTGLVLYYDFNQSTSDTSATDISGSDLSGTFSATNASNNGPELKAYSTTPSYTLPTGQYLSFDGNDYAIVTDPMPNNNNFTIETKFRTSTNDAVYRRIIGFNGFELEIALNQGELKIYDGSWRSTSATAIADDEWHHVALTYDGTDLKVYFDGIVVLTRTGVNSFGFGSKNMAIGAKTNGGEAFVGDIDDVHIWGVARTQTQLRTDVNTALTGSETDLYVQYNFTQSVLDQEINDNAVLGGALKALLGNDLDFQNTDPTFQLDTPASIVLLPLNSI